MILQRSQEDRDGVLLTQRELTSLIWAHMHNTHQWTSDWCSDTSNSVTLQIAADMRTCADVRQEGAHILHQPGILTTMQFNALQCSSKQVWDC